MKLRFVANTNYCNDPFLYFPGTLRYKAKIEKMPPYAAVSSFAKPQHMVVFLAVRHIQLLAGYLRSIVARVPELKNHTQCILTAITPALSSSFLDSNKNTVNILCGNIKSNIAALLETDSIPTHARIEADSIMHLLTESRLSDDNVKRLSAIKLLLFWLHDYWQYVCQSLYAYYLLNDICCVLSGAPVDYETRSNIVARINEFAMYVSRLDPINKFAIT